jgi:hypothetical protein
MRESIAVCSFLDSRIRRNDGLMTKAVVNQKDKLSLLAEDCKNIESAVAYLRFFLERTQNLMPRLHEPLSPEELERLESLASRFARLADMLIQRIMRLVDDIELTPHGTLLDRIYRAEKRRWVVDANTLIKT